MTEMTATLEALFAPGKQLIDRNRLRAYLESQQIISLTDPEFGAKGGGADDSAAFEKFIAKLDAIGYGAVGRIPRAPRGGYQGFGDWVVTRTIKLPTYNGWTIFGDHGPRVTRIRLIDNGPLPVTDLFDTGITWANRTRDAGLLNLWLIGQGTGTRYGLKWVASGPSHLDLRVGGFVNPGGAGVYTEDSMLVTGRLDLDGNWIGLLETGGANSGNNGWTVELLLENNLYLAASLYSAFGCTFFISANESNQGGGIDITTAGSGNTLIGYLGEENVVFDLRLGLYSFISGTKIIGYINGSATYYPIATKYAAGLDTSGCTLNIGSRFLEFLPGNAVRDSDLSVTYGAGVNPIPDPGDAQVTWKGIDASFLNRRNRFSDYRCFPCNDTNLVRGDMPYSDWLFSTSGTSTFVRSPNTGSVPDAFSGRPVGLLTTVGSDTNSIYRQWTVGAQVNQAVRNAWVTFGLEVFFDSASQIQFAMKLDDVAAVKGTITPSGTNATAPTPYYVSGYFGAAVTALRALLDSFSASGAKFKLGNAGVWIGMNPERFPRLSGPPIFFGLTGIPTAGTFALNDRAARSAAVGQPKGWTWTAAGSPGTPTSEGNL